MSVGPFPAAPLVARLIERVPRAKVVGTVADLTTALNPETPPNASPALYVVINERGKPIKYTGPGVVVQDCEVTVGVVLLVRNAQGERLGTGARTLADLVITDIRAALLGWTPTDAFNALSFLAGRDDSYRTGWYAGQQMFRTDYRMQQQVTP